MAAYSLPAEQSVDGLDIALDVFIEFDDYQSVRDVMMMLDNLDMEEEMKKR